MSVQRRPATALCLAVIALLSVSNGAAGQAAKRDAIGDWLKTGGSTVTPADPAKQNVAKAAIVADPRDGDPQYERAKALMIAIDAILKDAADTRAGASKLPSRDDYFIPPFWKETREDRNAKVRDLLDAALGIVANAPIVEVQKKVEQLRHNIHEIEDLNVKLKEKQLVAPKDATLPGILTDTVASI